MISKITSKYQTTIPKKVRNKFKLHIADTIEWKIEGDKIIVEPSSKPFLKYKASIKVSPGNTKDDILGARKIRAESY